MEIQKNEKVNKISKESEIILKNFHQKQINSNIKLHKIFLILVILINVVLLLFMVFYKSKIVQIKKLILNSYKSKINSNNIELETEKISLNKKMVNIASLGCFEALRFSFIFSNSEEFKNVKKLIYYYAKELGYNISNYNQLEPHFVYQGTVDNDDYSVFIEKMSYFETVLILIEIENGNKFGIFHRGLIKIDNKNEFNSYSPYVFLFSFNNDNIFKFIGKNKSLSFSNDILLSLGDNELVIYDNYLTKGGYINFPLKSYDFSNVKNNNILTNKNGAFKIKDIEVYCCFSF